MKILKIKKGFITNSSGSYEWLPQASGSPDIGGAGNTPAPASPSATPQTSALSTVAPSGAPVTGARPQKEGLDPSVMVLAVIVSLITVAIGAAKIVKAAIQKLNSRKKRK